MMQIPVGALFLLPLLGFIINFFLGRKLPKVLVGIIGSGTVLLSFIISLFFFFRILNGDSAEIGVSYFSWLHVGNFSVEFSFLIDRLSSLMLLIITGIGFLIHVYSIGYMHDDEAYNRFFSYLNLFIFFMIILVTGANYPVLFIGWEGVGLCSYLLIGFWYRVHEYNNAAKKAFIMNRIGDLGLLLGMFLLWQVTGSLSFTNVLTPTVAGAIPAATLTAITLLFFIGAIGKSAQLPLYTWLPDAMAGPTPVSALIHAATMVTAGVYLIVRSNVLYALAPYTLDIVLIIGVSTAVFAATIGLAQNDIKKVLAYSTVSQLGFMFMALGLGAYSTAMFHLTTHAFFKALLFLGAGSVIHAMGGEQDIRGMGGLKKALPITFITFLLGTLAITGIPPFSGFFSKDEILAKAFEANILIWVLGLIGSAITALYMFRLLFLTFFGSFRGTEEQKHQLHESPVSMTFPLIILAVLSVIGGVLGLPEAFHLPHAFNNWLQPILAGSAHGEAHHLSASTEAILMAISAAIAIAAIPISKALFTKKPERLDEAKEPTGMRKILANKYYVDEIYNYIVVKPMMWASVQIHKFIELGFIDGIVRGVGRGAQAIGGTLRYVQTGNIGFYLFAMVFGIILIIVLNQVFLR